MPIRFTPSGCEPRRAGGLRAPTSLVSPPVAADDWSIDVAMRCESTDHRHTRCDRVITDLQCGPAWRYVEVVHASGLSAISVNDPSRSTETTASNLVAGGGGSDQRALRNLDAHLAVDLLGFLGGAPSPARRVALDTRLGRRPPPVTTAPVTTMTAAALATTRVPPVAAAPCAVAGASSRSRRPRGISAPGPRYSVARARWTGWRTAPR